MKRINKKKIDLISFSNLLSSPLNSISPKRDSSANKVMEMNHHLLLLTLFIFSTLVFSDAKISNKIGINYGQLGNNLPSPSHSIQLIKSINLSSVRLYDANPEILKALSGTNLRVTIMVPNEQIFNISSNQTLADEWVQKNLIPFYPKTKIQTLLVGNEVLSFNSDEDRKAGFVLVPAMLKIQKSLKKFNLPKIKVGTTVAIDVVEAISTRFPPSNGTFRSDISVTVIKPLLQFINRTKSFFYLDVYTYFPWSVDSVNENLDYALLRGNLTYTDPGTGLTYTNLLDEKLDSVFFAMTKLGYPDTRLVIAETGWPSKGDIDQIGANVYNAATYNRNLVKKMTAMPPTGTPARPGLVIPTSIFALYNENQKGGPGTERNWGLLYPNGTRVYELDLTGKQPKSEYKPLPAPMNNKPYKGKLWCVVAEGPVKVNTTALASALKFACGKGNGTCDAIQPGKKCYKPDSLVSHANYAFSSYWVQFRNSGWVGTCFFNGLAVQTTKDPSYGSCKFPSVNL